MNIFKRIWDWFMNVKYLPKEYRTHEYDESQLKQPTIIDPIYEEREKTVSRNLRKSLKR